MEYNRHNSPANEDRHANHPTTFCAPVRFAEIGAVGALGRTEVRRADGRIETLGGCDPTVLQPGDAVIVTTPTGGGFGAPD